jgi:hypothetical protein
LVVQELAGLLIDILDWHKFLVEDYLLVDVRGLHVHQLSDIFQDYQAEGDVLPKETGIQIQGDLLAIGAFDGKHGERHAAVADVGVEYSLEGGSVTNLSLVHRADALLHGHNLVEVQLGVTFQQGLFYGLDLVVEILDLISRLLIESFIE